MNVRLRKMSICIAALLVAIATIIFISQNPARIGNEPLVVRAAMLSLAVCAALIAVYPFSPFFSARPVAYVITICLPALVPVLAYYFFILPNQAGSGISAEQIQSALITDSSSNGIIEVGFSYPIYTPSLRISNHGLYTKQVNVFFRMIDGSSESVLFRAVRAKIPSSSLSVEATVQGMLSESEGYEFNPLEIPPGRTLNTKVVFIISNLDDGATFTEALEKADQASFELRDPESGELLLDFPLTRI